MSVSTMARLAEGDSAEPDSTLQSALRLLAAYIPSEALAVYIAVLGLLNPSPEATGQDVTIVRLICLAIGLVVAISLPLDAQREPDTRERRLRIDDCVSRQGPAELSVGQTRIRVWYAANRDWATARGAAAAMTCSASWRSDVAQRAALRPAACLSAVFLLGPASDGRRTTAPSPRGIRRSAGAFGGPRASPCDGSAGPAGGRALPQPPPRWLHG
jgi:hypothetical protein